MSTKTLHKLVFTVQTTDATVTTLGTVQLPAGSVGFAKSTIVAREASVGTSSGWQIAGAAKHLAGNAAIIGSIQSLVAVQQDVLAATWVATLDAAGNDVRIRITGQIGTTIDWMAELEVVVYTP